MNPTAILLGVMAGVGVNLMIVWRNARIAHLENRIAPHLRASIAQETLRRHQAVTPFPTIERILAPVVRDGVRWVEKWGTPTQVLDARLARAGSSLTVEQYRAQQVLWAVGGLAAGLFAATALASTRGSSPVSLVVLVAGCAIGGAFARDQVLQRAVARREAAIVSELPTIAELLALAVSAGEGALGALERVSRVAGGVMAHELRHTLGSVRAGLSLPGALSELADRTGAVPLRRFADAVATAVERGTPLAEVLRAQAEDVRFAGQRALMEEGGKREIAMMIPVVFLILPVTVLFAVFPGVATIKWGI